MGARTWYRLAAMLEHETTAPGPAGAGPPRPLYPRLLGASWDELHLAVRRAHGGGPLTRAEGVFVVSRPGGRLLGWLLDVAGVPRASGQARLRLVVEVEGAGEHWSRAFDGRPLTTHQSEAPGGLLSERIGPLEFRLRLAARDGDLLFRQVGVALCVGRWRLAVPHWLAPQIAGREGAADGVTGGPADPARTKVEVRVTGPGGGLLFSYRGTVRWEPSGWGP